MALATTPKMMVTMVCLELEAIDEARTMAGYRSGRTGKCRKCARWVDETMLTVATTLKLGKFHSH